MHQLPETGFLRITQIVGNPKAKPPIPALLPVSRATWWKGVQAGRFPKPIKLGPQTTCWRVADILDLIKQLSNTEAQTLAPAALRPARGHGVAKQHPIVAADEGRGGE